MQIPPHSPLQPALQCPALTTATPPTWPFSQAEHGSPERCRSFAPESAQAGHGATHAGRPTTHGPSARPSHGPCPRPAATGSAFRFAPSLPHRGLLQTAFPRPQSMGVLRARDLVFLSSTIRLSQSLPATVFPSSAPSGLSCTGFSHLASRHKGTHALHVTALCPIYALFQAIW